MDLQAYFRWQDPPFRFLSDEQKIQFRNRANNERYSTGEIIWTTDNPGKQFSIVSGRVRLQEMGTDKTLGILTAGDWFGDLLDLSGQFQARAASKDVEVVYWESKDWQNAASAELDEFWQQQRASYQLENADLPQPVSGYPFIFSPNTAVACLAMVAEDLKNPVSFDSIQRQLLSSQPNDVVAAGEKLGLQLQELRVNWDDLRQLSFPLLLRWQQQDWIVVYGLKRNRAIVANPTNHNRTCETLPRSLLEENWNGQLWQVELLQKSEKFDLSWFVPAVWRYRKLLGEVLLASLTLQILGLATPILTQFIIDRAIVYGNLGTLDVMAVALLGVALFEALLGILRLFIFSHTTNRLDLSLSAQVFRHLMQLPLNYFESRRVGDTVARVQELENIRQFLTGTALSVLLDSVFSVVYLAIMFSYNVTLTWVALAVIPLFAALTVIGTPWLRHWLNETFNRNADSQSFLVETVTGIQAVKAHAAEPEARRRWEGLFARYIRTSFKATTTSNIGNNIGDFLTNFSYLIILWFGARQVIDEKLTIGALVAFQMLSARVTGPLLRLVELWQEFQQVLLSVDRLGDILNAAPEAQSGTGLILESQAGKVTFDKVFFRYQPDTEYVLDGISFTAEPGMFVGIVGRSGSGKSTVSKLIQRLYEVESGTIAIDDFDIKKADITSLRQRISVVLQDDFLFNSSVIENITLGDVNITEDQAIAAAKQAVADEFVIQLPQSYDTNIGERGVSLSGGQRQRLALARLFLSSAPILILDEATSSLDSETEQKVLNNLRQISQNRTVFMVAHRFAPLKEADLILVLEKGTIAEYGTHEELLRKKGVYSTLYQRQQASV
ncbi:MAG: type I secretion system permease/ATPase [Cyanosarcina radialis HA8281-LM2]|jgi:ATP-binding cassette subfamily B protein|nr:type I secretion system permease/ATPase [Cyanosarcina radialis HA8281-LM2]